MPIVGTAGHVDHGKSTLVRALTGIDPDRWAEEKERGLTIDLGFAWTDLGGHDVGFVDVPGHERFIKNMLAGVGALDCALFVVAADSGWMPQSEEHAAVLDLLGVERGVIALSRTDLVDDDTVELATLEVLEEVEGTSLAGWPIVPVSPITGSGLDELRTAIVDVLDSAPPPPARRFRMWVDRAFRPSGAGLVVTGTVLEGTVVEGDRILVLPAGEAATVRSIQHHGAATTHGVAGSRTAINLSGAPDDTERGDLLAGSEEVAVTTRLLARLRPARSFEAIPDRGAFHLHVGTRSTPAGIRRVRGTDAFVVSLDDEAPLVAGDRVILRDSGRRAVVGGGVVLDPLPAERPTAGMVGVLEGGLESGPTARAQALVEVHGMIDRDDLNRSVGGIESVDAVVAGSVYLSRSTAAEFGDRIAVMAGDHHTAHPVRPGIPKGEVASRVGIPIEVVDAVVAASPAVEDRSGAIALADFVGDISTEQEAEWAAVRATLEQTFDVPRESAIELDEEVRHFLVRRGDLVRVGDDLVYTASQVEEIDRRVAELPDGFTVADFRDHFGMARRQAVPTLEWLDATGRTRRSGDGRTVRG